ncbi:hypothetical protein AVEN_43432-1 [Araneus ventricosus]|uniref:Uncharacterized protein n=1 Tax=Araneus ventricosus TaxID=182803 RepID=A0A4Y2WG08_ARAVE|nr:hypothetical protein AVEN_43432-1 [Araneus ventricosus]
MAQQHSCMITALQVVPSRTETIIASGKHYQQQTFGVLKLAASQNQIDTEFGLSKAQVRYRGKVLRNGKKDGAIQQRDHGLRNFSNLKSIDCTVTSTITKC